MSIGYDGVVSDNVSVEFLLGRCYEDGRIYLDEDGVSHVTSEEAGYCNLEYGSCCEDGYECDEGICKIDEGWELGCKKHENLNDCNAEDDRDLIEQTAGYVECPDGDCESLSCEWLNTNECTFKQICYSGTTCYNNTVENLCATKICEPSNVVLGECLEGMRHISADSGACDDTLNYCESDGTPISGGDYCENQHSIDCPAIDKEVPCGRLNFELGFFEYAHFLTAMIIISMIYLGIYWRRDGKE